MRFLNRRARRLQRAGCPRRSSVSSYWVITLVVVLRNFRRTKGGAIRTRGLRSMCQFGGWTTCVLISTRPSPVTSISLQNCRVARRMFPNWITRDAQGRHDIYQAKLAKIDCDSRMRKNRVAKSTPHVGIVFLRLKCPLRVICGLLSFCQPNDFY